MEDDDVEKEEMTMLRRIILRRRMTAEDEVDDHDVAEDEVEGGDVEDDDAKGEKYDDVDVEDDDVEEDDVEEEDRSQDRETHLVRACAIECRDRHWAQNADTHTLCEPAQSKCASRCHKKHQKSHFKRKSTQKKCRGPDWAQNADKHFARACEVEMHAKVSQEPLYTEIYNEKLQS